VIRLAVRVGERQAELVLAELLELAPAGVEEVRAGDGVVEYAVYGAPGELPSLHDVDTIVGEALVEVSTTEIPDDWHERWKRFHRPVLVRRPDPLPGQARHVPDLHLRPPWEAPSGRGRAVEEIVIDPGQAFGTGAHASTRLCLELLLDLAAHERTLAPLVDVGTGSGVLAIAAARLGFQPVLALDNERESVEAARDNAAANDTAIEVRRFDLRSQALPSPQGPCAEGPAPVVLANLLRPLLLDLTARISFAPAHLLAGGLLEHEVDEVVGAFRERLDLHERERRREGEWAAVWLASC
jgi:ribosomal protein L11 methyltransferase